MLEYFVFKRKFKNLTISETQEKYVAKLDQKSKLTMEELSERVAKRCTLAPYEVRLAMDAMEDVWYEAFERGRPIQIGTIGTLHPTIRATLQDSAETVNQKSIKKVSCCLRFSSKFKQFLKDIKLRKIVTSTSDLP